MDKPILSKHFQERKPSSIRSAQIEFAKRADNVNALNVAIGNVSLPMHPVMQKRMKNLAAPESPFHDGVVKYTSTVGIKETNEAGSIVKSTPCMAFTMISPETYVFSSCLATTTDIVIPFAINFSGKNNNQKRPVSFDCCNSISIGYYMASGVI